MVAITFEPAPLTDGAVRRPRLSVVAEPQRRRPAAVVGYVVAAAILAVAFGYLALSPVPGDPSEIGVTDTAYVAEPGDTMWSIAQDVAPAGTAAAYVERLVAVNGTSVVEAGQVVVLPTS